MKVVIEGRLPGMNEIIGSNRTGWHQGSKEKKELTDYCKMYFLKAMRQGSGPVSDQCDLVIEWYEPNNKRDSDNIFSGIKFILDGAVKAGFIPNDNYKYIRNITNIRSSSSDPRIEIHFEVAADGNR